MERKKIRYKNDWLHRNLRMQEYEKERNHKKKPSRNVKWKQKWAKTELEKKEKDKKRQRKKREGEKDSTGVYGNIQIKQQK